VQAGDDKPAVTNLLTIFSLAADITVKQLESDYAGKGYGVFKADLADALVAKFGPMREAFSDHYEEQALLEEVLASGRFVAEVLAEATLDDVKAKLGLL